MRKTWFKLANAMLAISLASFFTLATADLVIAGPANPCVSNFQVDGSNCVATFSATDGAKDLKFPTGLGAIQVELFGAPGGTGGIDCGIGCTHSASSQVGHLVLNFADLSGKTIKLYPGNAGSDGASGVTSNGSGAGGVSTFGPDYDGGRGGNAGSAGSSGAGGGGGAASLVSVNNISYVAAGGGGGGGSANSTNGSTAGSTQAQYAASGSAGALGTDVACNPFCDGGGGGGGGGGVIGGSGGGLYAAPAGGESAGSGGYAGTNVAVGGAVTLSEYVDPQTTGLIKVTYAAQFAPSSIDVLTSTPTNAAVLKVQFTLPSSSPIRADEITFSGSVTSQTQYAAALASRKVVGSQTTYVYKITQQSKANVVGDLVVALRGVKSPTISIDQVAPQATIQVQANSLTTPSHLYDVRLDKDAIALKPENFAPAAGTAKGCQVGSVVGSGRYFIVSLDSCGDGTFGLTLLANSLVDQLGNQGPPQDQVSELSDQRSPALSVQITDGQIPKEFLKTPVEKVFAPIDESTKTALESLGIYAPMDGAPVANIVSDLSNSAPGDPVDFQTSQQVDVGSSIDLGVRVSDAIAQSSDLIAFVRDGANWQYLGRQPFVNNVASADAFGVAATGDYKIRMVIINKAVITTMSLKSGFGKGLPLAHTSVTDSQTNLGTQQVDLTLTVVSGDAGTPAVVENLSSDQPVIPNPVDNLLSLSVPTINLGEPVANMAIGATGNDSDPSVPFDPLGSPAAVAHVVKTTATAVAVVSTVAAAASAAAGAAAGAASGAAAGAASRSASTASPSTATADSEASDQDTNEEDGQIHTISADVETFTSVYLGIGDRFPLFRFKFFTFLDKFSNNLTTRLAKFSPVISKIVNDGAYLRAMLGSFWLAFPIAGILLATIALKQPSVEISPPQWQIFIAIGILGVFDAFSGLLATLIFVIGMADSYGIKEIADIRLLLGILVMGFGPALISIAFRDIRKHFENNFPYFWERLTDIAMLLFFTSLTVTSMVATLPALAGKTLSAANHVADFGFWLSVVIVVRILFEEIAARAYPHRLDIINPTEVPSVSQLQKVISTSFRLALFVFVTAAFMGNTWQVWVGSIIFILPNVLSWVSGKLPNFPIIWRIFPTGLPGMAFSIVVSTYTGALIGSWIGQRDDFAQWAFMMMPLPMFGIGLIRMFGRHGKRDEIRAVKKPQWRWVYRLGGIVMLVVTAKLSGSF